MGIEDNWFTLFHNRKKMLAPGFHHHTTTYYISWRTSFLTVEPISYNRLSWTGRDLLRLPVESTVIPPRINTSHGGVAMNKETQLLAMLDNVFGFPNKFRSNFRKVSQSFDQQTNEHVILIEYRVRVKGTMTSQPRQNAQQQNQQQQQMAFLRQLVAQGKTKWQLLPLSLHSPEMSTGSTSIRIPGLTDRSPGTRKINWSQSTKLISPRNQWGSTGCGVGDWRWFFWTPKTVVWSWMVVEADWIASDEYR